MPALLLLALLGCDSFPVREAAHAELTRLLPLLRPAVERWATGDGERARRCQSILDREDTRLLLAGRLHPRGWDRLPRIEYLPGEVLEGHWPSPECLRAAMREYATELGHDDPDRAATGIALATLYRCGVPLAAIRELLEDLAANEARDPDQ